MIKVIFGIVFTGALYYVLRPLSGGRVRWIEAEEGDRRTRELELEKRINLKALKDIEFELASGKINDQDYEELREHYMRRVTRVMGQLEGWHPSGDGPVPEADGRNRSPGQETAEVADGEDTTADGASAFRAYDPSGPEAQEDEGEQEDDREDDEWDEEDDHDGEEDEEYAPRAVRPHVLTALVLGLSLATGLALFQLGRRSASPPAAPQEPVSLYTAPPPAASPAVSGQKEGLDHLIRYVQENPWNVTSHLILGEYYFGEGDTDLALAHFLSAEEVDPDDTRVLQDLGKAYRKMGDPDRAIEKFQAAAETEPDSLEPLYQLGLVYFHDKGDGTRAAELFREILSREPDDSLRALVSEELKRLTESDG